MRDLEQSLLGEGPLFLEELLQRVSLHILEHEVGPDVWVVSHVEDLNDIRMMEQGRRARLVLEAAQEHLAHLGIEGQVAERLHGDLPVEIGVMRQVDVAHGARPEETLDAVAANSCGQVCHGRDLMHPGVRG